MGALFDHCHKMALERKAYWKMSEGEKRQFESKMEPVSQSVFRNFLVSFSEIYVRRERHTGPIQGMDKHLDDVLCTWCYLGPEAREAVSRLAKKLSVLNLEPESAPEPEPQPAPKPETKPEPADDDHRVSFRKMANALIACNSLTDAELGKFLRVVREVVFSVERGRG